MTDPRCYGNEILDKNGYNSACIKDISEFFESNRKWVIQATCMK